MQENENHANSTTFSLFSSQTSLPFFVPLIKIKKNLVLPNQSPYKKTQHEDPCWACKYVFKQMMFCLELSLFSFSRILWR
ncbi:hypothetical protein CpecG_0501 [Chlamydia pecorum MC/MarsBar]|nr:hypothetical protein CpecF_0503 [Chlamydia pecorum DBDeUG]ETF40076.1 hypothetical protein CpecG_0501 [Chlamydia pecorum MC/MarsBar]ETF40611.1 hypothetical protein CpecA_0505 [Chlamydia pecorum IPTaLE]